MRVLLAVALLMMCGAAGAQQAKPKEQHLHWWHVTNKDPLVKFTRDVLVENATGEAVGEVTLDPLDEQRWHAEAWEGERNDVIYDKDFETEAQAKVALQRFIERRLQQPQPAKQEKAQPPFLIPAIAPPHESYYGDCWSLKNPNGHLCDWDELRGFPKKEHPLPFDLPAKEWDAMESHVCVEQLDGSCKDLPKLPVHHVSCKDVAPDWQQRVLLQTADGKEHCFAFYLLEQKP